MLFLFSFIMRYAFSSSSLNGFLEDIHTRNAASEISIAPVITYFHPPMDHKNDDNALPNAANMKLLTTKTVFNLLRSSLDKLNSLVWLKTDIPCTAIDNIAATSMMAIIES